MKVILILKQSEQCDLWSGDYKCEITYLDGAGPACPVLQLLGRLVVVELPRWVRIYRGDTQVRPGSYRTGQVITFCCS